MNKNLYLVPHDLTAVGNKAFEYALNLCERVEAEIMVLNIVDSKSKIKTVESKLNELISKFSIPPKASIKMVVQEGNIFNDIGKIASKNHVQLIIMGTHGQKGMQKLFRSYAIQVISSCDIPFLIVQADAETKNFEKILVPIDLNKESLQIIKPAGSLSKIYQSELHVIARKETDELLNQQMKNRIQIIQKQYEDDSVNCSIKLLDSRDSYSKQIEKYANEHKIDLIAFSYFSLSIIPQFDKHAQNIMMNQQKIPCMIINAKESNSYF